MLGLSIVDVAIFFSVTLVALYFYLRRNAGYWSKRGIPCPPPSIIVGNVGPSVMMQRSFGELITDVYHKYQGHKVAGFFNFGMKPTLVLRDPELIYKIMVTDFHSFRNNDAEINPEADPISARNIFLQKDEMWKKNRALITPAFTVGKIKPTFNIIENVSKQLVDYLKKHPEDLMVKQVMSRYTAEITATCGFGIDGHCFTEEKPMIHELGKKIFEPGFVNGIKFLLFLSIPKLATALKIRLVPQDVVDFFEKVLRDVIEYRQKSDEKRNDLLSYWIELKKKSVEVEKGNITSDLVTKTLTNDDILSGCVTFFLETYESSAWTMNNILYLLALNTDVQKKLQHEIDETVAKNKEITFDIVMDLPYLNCVIQESIRCMPIAYALAKRCTERYNLDLGDGKSLVIEEGTSVAIPFYPIFQDPKYWEQPDKFNPDRFANGDPTPKGVFIPFGIGPRMCIGMRTATAIIKTAIFNILKEMNVVATEKTPRTFQQDPRSFFLVHKDGIYLKFAPRNKN